MHIVTATASSKFYRSIQLHVHLVELFFQANVHQLIFAFHTQMKFKSRFSVDFGVSTFSASATTTYCICNYSVGNVHKCRNEAMNNSTAAR